MALLTDEFAEKIHQMANVSKHISFEGDELVADIRRGSARVYQRTQQAIVVATKHKLVTGVANSVCKSK